MVLKNGLDCIKDIIQAQLDCKILCEKSSYFLSEELHTVNSIWSLKADFEHNDYDLGYKGL